MKKPEATDESPLQDVMDDWQARLDAACKAKGITSMEGVAFNEETGEVSDAMAWELEDDD